MLEGGWKWIGKGGPFVVGFEEGRGMVRGEGRG